MDKETFCLILQVALLNFEGLTETQINKYGIPLELARVGIAINRRIGGLQLNEVVSIG